MERDVEKSKRELILEAALKMFVENGFENSPTSKIAKSAGVATGTLFHYFKTKEDLINQLYLDVKVEMVTALKRELESAKTIKQQMEKVWYNFISWSLRKPEGTRFFAMFGTSAYITQETREEGYSHFVFVMDIMKEGIENEILKDIPMEMLTDIMFSILMGTTTYFQKYPAEFEDKSLRDSAFAIYWDSVKG